MTCLVCPKTPRILEALDGGWLVSCCALYWQITDQQLMDSL